jgi:hypothetical protein
MNAQEIIRELAKLNRDELTQVDLRLHELLQEKIRPGGKSWGEALLEVAGTGKFWNIRPLVNAPAPASVAEDMPESKEEQHAVVTLRTEFLDVQAKHAVAPIAFRETQRDFKRYAAVIAAKSVEDIKVGTGEVFRDEKDLRTFFRWILRGAPGTSRQPPKLPPLKLNLNGI